LEVKGAALQCEMACESAWTEANKSKCVMILYKQPKKKRVIKLYDKYKIKEQHWKIDPLPPVPICYLLKHLSTVTYNPRGFQV
jgi:hypothetical protein